MKKHQNIQASRRSKKPKKDPHYAFLSACVALLINNEVDFVSLKTIEQKAVGEYMMHGLFRNQIIWDREDQRFVRRAA